jgi:ribosomal protein S6--L-glutamate ligase
MKIVLLAKRSRAYSTERLIQAARARGHRLLALDPEDLSLVLDGAERPVVYHKSRRLLKVGIAIARLGAAPNEFAISALQCLEALGVPCLDAPEAILHARDRFRSLRALAAAGMRVPRTLLARRPEELERKIQLLGGPPVTLRLLQGTQNVGAIVAEKEHSIISIVESFWEAGKNILLQQYHPESRGRELRAFVVGGRVIGAIRRVVRLGEFRTQIHRTREAAPIELSRAHRALAIRAAEILGLSIAAVDLVEAKGGPVVGEVNPTPGLEEVERTTEIDVAGEIVRFAESFAAERAGKRKVPIGSWGLRCGEG